MIVLVGISVLKRLFISDTGEASFLHNHCSGLWETELQAILPGERASSQYDSLWGVVVLKKPFLGDTGEDLAHLFRSQETELKLIPWAQKMFF